MKLISLASLDGGGYNVRVVFAANPVLVLGPMDEVEAMG